MTVLHVDMDAFFASVEQRDHPEWRGKPIIVGAGPHERGVVSTCSYEARRYGVRSAMPSRTAYALCPNGIFVPPRMHAYQEVSDIAFEVFSHYSPFVEGVSVDEAFLDVTGTIHLFGDMRTLAERLRAEVKAKCGVTCSVGLAPNRLLAKIASEQNKPDGLFVMPIEADAIRAFLAPFLARLLGDAAAESIRNHAFGIDNSPFPSEEAEEKSVSREHTFAEDESDRETVRQTLLRLVEEVGRRFRREERWARTGKLKLRDAAFNTITRQARFELPARDDITFRHLMLDLFDKEWPPGRRRIVRLVGFGVTDITDTPEDPQPSLFGPSPLAEQMKKRERLAAALDALAARRQTTSRP